MTNTKRKNNKKGIKKTQGNVFAFGGDLLSGILGGVTSLAGSAISNLQVPDTLNQLITANNNEALMTQMGAYNPIEIAKSNVGGSALSGAATGASAGMTFGPLGAAIGGVVGGLSGGITSAIGNSKKKKLEGLLKTQQLGNFLAMAENIQGANTMNQLANFSATGGPIHINPANKGKFTASAKRADMGVQEFASHVLANKEDYSPLLVKRANFAHNAAGWQHAEGGDLNTFENGGTHEENPNGGIPQGVDENGTPNLVEEGESKFKNYIFSDRLKYDKKNTFSDMAKKYAKESNERPNDPISKRGLESNLSKLRQSQDTFKQMKEEQSNSFAKGGNLFLGGGPFENSWGLNNSRLKMVPDQAGIGTDNYMNDTGIPSEFSLAQNYGMYINQPPVKKVNKVVKPIVKPAAIPAQNPFEFNWNLGTGFTLMVPDKIAVAPTVPSTIAKISPTKGKTSSNTRTPLVLNKDINLSLEPSSPYTGLYVPATLPATKYNAPNVTPQFVGMLKAADAQSARVIPGVTGANDKNGADYSTMLRYAPALASGIASITDALGVTNKPDYTAANQMDALQVKGERLGNYMAYNPLDLNYFTNQLGANAAATRAGLRSASGGNRATYMAGLLGADAAYNEGLGKLARQATESNIAQRQLVEQFNRGTNQFNAQQGNWEQGINMQNKATAIGLRDQARQIANTSKMTNLNNFVESLGSIGQENLNRNMIKNDPSSPYWIDSMGNYHFKGATKKNGGKLKTKGITYGW